MRRGYDKERCPLYRGRNVVTRAVLKCLDTKMWSKTFCSKWLNINEVTSFKGTLICNNVLELMKENACLNSYIDGIIKLVIIIGCWEWTLSDKEIVLPRPGLKHVGSNWPCIKRHCLVQIQLVSKFLVLSILRLWLTFK
jgi:hypothetical protein